MLGPGEVEISWGWPLVSDVTAHSTEATAESRVVDKSVTHAVIQYTERGQAHRVTAQTSPYIYTGEAREFQVAVGRDGSEGSFRKVIPYEVLKAKENLSKEDLGCLKRSENSLCRMGHTLDIVIRLFSQAVISQVQRDKLVRMCRLEGQHHANIYLMEEVTRMTYSELFQFKKCLLETGQIVLARTVPVETVPAFEEKVSSETSIVPDGCSTNERQKMLEEVRQFLKRHCGGESLEQLTEEQEDQIPTQRLLRLIASLAPDPEEFGVQLGYKRQQVRNRFLSDTSQTREDQTLSILEAWVKKTKTKPTVGRLMHALQACGIPEQKYRSVVLEYFIGASMENSDDEEGTPKQQTKKNLLQKLLSKLKRK